MTEDKADFKLLSLANEKRKFAIAIGYSEPWAQGALERGIDNEWFTLVDVSPVNVVPGDAIMRIFRLTEAGMIRLAQLKTAQLDI